jgi:hypothetical protein
MPFTDSFKMMIGPSKYISFKINFSTVTLTNALSPGGHADGIAR